jgi:hypothetical protein
VKLSLLLALALLAGAVLAQAGAPVTPPRASITQPGTAATPPRDPCLETYNTEVVGIQREAKAKQAVGSDAAKQRAARGAETQLAAAARRAKQCQDEAKAPADPTKAAAKAAQPAAPTDDCKARTSDRAADIERRFGGETLDPAQQAARREDEIRLRAELNDCRRRGR